MIRIAVGEADFDAGAEVRRLQAAAGDAGAIASFIGVVRPQSGGEALLSMTLEHYPGMTERALEEIAQAACSRFALSAVTIVHRVGRLVPGAQIVFAGAASGHRQAAFEGVQFLMDYLKTQAPFWKLEERVSGDHWVEARSSDDEAAARWERR
ncbi:MAG: molybdenum cofactor biosynthesis protein MoaE [Alphaproteobacteria bacterium]|nr:molybdenum cofactor biosynthesis protein MoaE [Alphaproteobacteria bacterium]